MRPQLYASAEPVGAELDFRGSSEAPRHARGLVGNVAFAAWLCGLLTGSRAASAAGDQNAPRASSCRSSAQYDSTHVSFEGPRPRSIGGKKSKMRQAPGQIVIPSAPKRARRKPADQNLRGHVRQRPAHPDLDSTDRHAAVEIPATTRALRLVLVESGRPARQQLLSTASASWQDTPSVPPSGLGGLHDGQLALHFPPAV